MCGLLLISTLNQEGVGFSETLVPVYQMIWCHISEGQFCSQVSKNIYFPLVSEKFWFRIPLFRGGVWRSDVLALTDVVQRKC
jgi:hypothetical protein